MSERATRPLNKEASKAADDDLYSKHADDPRPNALYDEDGNRKPLSATDPDQADLRKEWMNSYKANGGQTEPTDVSGAPAGQSVLPCGQKAQVDPLIVGDSVEVDDSEVPEPKVEEEVEEPEEPAPDEDEPEPEPEPILEPISKALQKGQPEEDAGAGESEASDETGAADEPDSSDGDDQA